MVLLFYCIITPIIVGEDVKKLLFYFSICTLLYAESYPCFTQQELQKSIISDYTQTLIKYKELPKEQQLSRLNFYLNQLRSEYDSVTQHTEDKWATPKEFLKLGYGDCEDYALIKYYSLIKLGFNKKDLFLTLVKEHYYGRYHMVLSYFNKKALPPLVLDNLSYKILNLDKRNDLTPLLFINTTGVYKADKRYRLQKVAEKYKEFEEIQRKVKQNL